MVAVHRSSRASAVALIFVLLAVSLDAAAAAATQGKHDAPGAAKGAAVPPLPEPLTRESARDLVSRLSDQQARALLLDQLDKSAASAAAAAPGTPAMGGMAGMIDSNVGTMRGRIRAMYVALLALPATLRDAAARLTGGPGALPPWQLALYLATMLAAGWLVELAYDRALRGYRSRLMASPATTFSGRTFQLAVGLVLDLGALAAFGIGALAIFFTQRVDSDLERVTLVLLTVVVVMVRIAVLLGRFLLAPGDDGARLLPFADRDARTLRRFVVALAAMFGVAILAASLLGATGVDDITLDVVRVALWVVGITIVLWTTWSVRRPIADAIRGDRDRATLVGRLADLWPVAATAYFVALFAGGIGDVLVGAHGPVGRGFASILVVLAIPLADMFLCRALAAAAERNPSVATGILGAYQPIFRRAVHIVVIVLGLLAIADLWDLNLFAIAEEGLGQKIASSLLGIGLVLLAAYLLWEITKTAIDRRLQSEGARSDNAPASRLRTLLPILRATLLATIAVMTAMSVLAALGVDILPLLAGASVVGVAIGFGSQKLVRDIVSGAFFLMDDAFRLGEYIEVGSAKGTVEKINIRTVFLRHQRGAINIVPYGEIKQLRNTSRDWQVHVLEFRLTYDTNMLEVKKILKKVGDELAADEDYAPDLIQPLKSAGVIATEDSAIVVRAKFTARPGNNQWVVRRMAYDKIIRAFRQSGIRFAHRVVTVNVPSSTDASAAERAGAAVSAAAEPAKEAQR